MRRLTPIPAVALLALLAAAPAFASINYVGQTDQGNDFNLRTDDAGVPERASYGWDMNCKGGGSLTNGGTVSRFPGADVNGMKSAGKYEAPIENRFVGVFKGKIRGNRASDTRFTGTFKVKVKVFKKSNGDLLTKCSTGIVRWSADRTTPVEPPGLPRAAEADLRLR